MFMRALVVTFLLLATSVSQANPFPEHGNFLTAASIMDQYSKYEARYLASVSALYHHFGMTEGSRVEISFHNSRDEKPTLYAVEVKFCFKGNPRVCLDDSLQRNFVNTVRDGTAKQEVHLSTLGHETLSSMAALMKRDELVMVMVVKQVSPWFWPDQIEGTTTVNFRHVLMRGGYEGVIPTQRHITVRVRFAPQLDMN